MAVDNQLLIHALAIYLGTTIMQFFNALIRDLILPLITPLASSDGGMSTFVVQAGPFKLNIGDILVQTANLLIVFAVVSFALPYLREYVPVAGRR